MDVHPCQVDDSEPTVGERLYNIASMLAAIGVLMLFMPFVIVALVGMKCADVILGENHG